MESIADVKEALQARAKTATIEELRDAGRRRVRIIRAEHVAAMIDDAVQHALANAGLVNEEQVQRLVTESRNRFVDLLREREEELAAAKAASAELQRVRAERTELQRRCEELEAQLAQVQATAVMPGNQALISRLLGEVAEMKAQMGSRPAQPAAQTAPASQGTENAMTSALEKIANSLNDRLDQFGRKMGISSAVEADSVKLDGLFAHADEKPLESNMDAVKVKQKSGGGIGNALERLKKLKGGS